MKGILGLLQIMRLLSCVSTVTSFPRNVFAVELGWDSGGIIMDIALGCVVGRVRLILKMFDEYLANKEEGHQTKGFNLHAARPSWITCEVLRFCRYRCYFSSVLRWDRMNGTISFFIYENLYLHMFGMTLNRDDDLGGGWSCQLWRRASVRGDQKRMRVWRNT